jgi:hypothetical protein
MPVRDATPVKLHSIFFSKKSLIQKKKKNASLDSTRAVFATHKVKIKYHSFVHVPNSREHILQHLINDMVERSG